MMEIKQITTVDELYQNQGAKTGQIVVDAVVDYIRKLFPAHRSTITKSGCPICAQIGHPFIIYRLIG